VLKDEARRLVYEWLNSSDRLPLPLFRKKYGIRKTTFQTLRDEWKSMHSQPEEEFVSVVGTDKNGRKYLDIGEKAEEPSNGESTVRKLSARGVSEKEKMVLIRKVYQDAVGDKATAKDKELAVKALGLLIEKKEVVSVEVTPEYIARRNLGAEKRYREFLESGRGVAGVQGAPRLLPGKTRLDTEQEHSED